MTDDDIRKLAGQMRVQCANVIGFHELIVDTPAADPLEAMKHEVWFHAAALGLALNMRQLMTVLGIEDS